MTVTSGRSKNRRKPLLAPRRRPSQARSRGTVDALLIATARVLVRRGFAGTTTNHIALAAGVSVGTLYEYFPSKDALVHALIDAHLERAQLTFDTLASTVASIRSEMTVERLARALVDAMVELHSEAPRLHRVLFEEVPHTPAVRRRVRALEDRATLALAAAFTAMPQVRVSDPSIAARVVVELLESLTHRWITAPDGTPVSATCLANELVVLIAAYLRA